MREWLARDTVPLQEPVAQPIQEPESPPPLHVGEAIDDVDVAIGEAKRFRAALADALAVCLDDVLRDVAGDVIARELQLAPCDVDAIVKRAVERYGNETVRIRANPSDVHALAGSDATVIPDERLRGGDLLFETRHGSIDASLGIRLERVLTKWTA